MSDFNYPQYKDNYVKFGTFHDWFTPGAPKSSDFYHTSEWIVGENYSTKNRRDPDGKYRRGGAWLMVQRKYESWGAPSQTFRAGWALAYDGSYGVSDSGNTYIFGRYVTPMSKEAYANIVNSYGAEAFAALKPDTPDFSPVASLFELREQHGSLRERWRELLAHIAGKRGLGRYWLALNFGYLALLGDTLSFVNAFGNGKKRFEQLLRDAGRPVRRRRSLRNRDDSASDELHSDVATLGTAYHPSMVPVHVSQCYGGGFASHKGTASRTTKVWCVGKSRFYLPPGPQDSVEWKRDMARRILGLQLTPSAVYNCIPWSWLVDYFTGLGHFMDAVSDGIADRVVFEYAYLMHEEKHEMTHECTQYVWTSPSTTGPVSAYRRETEVRKSRIVASPFGFGLKHEDLTPRQAGILGALGLTMI